MKFFKIITLISALTLNSCIVKEAPIQRESIDYSKNNAIQIGLIDTIHSTILKEDRELIIYLPESAKDATTKREKYPILYLLDGRDNFIQMVAMLQRYSEKNNSKILPEMIIVGIPNENYSKRTMDFSPTTAGEPETYGRGNDFLEFIDKELFPYIENKYSPSTDKTIIGHSFGGVVVMNALTRYTHMFDNYMMIDGSLHFDNELFLNNEDYSVENKDLKNKNLFIAIANTATYGSTLESIRKDTIRSNRFVRHSLKLVDQIESSDTKINMEWKYYENETHGTTNYLSQLDALRFFYSWFDFKEEHKYRNKYFIPETEDDKFAVLVKKHFEKVSQELGYKYKPEMAWLSSYAYSLNSFQNQPEQAIQTYELNIEYYPDNPQVYIDLAEFYSSQNNSILAKEYYGKADVKLKSQ